VIIISLCLNVLQISPTIIGVSATDIIQMTNCNPFLHKSIELQTIDLASDTAWTISLDGKPSRPIKVPGGGWNSDQQSPRIDRGIDVQQYVVYVRQITLPNFNNGDDIKIMFGAVNFGAEIYINDIKIMEHNGAMTPFEADLTNYVSPGQTVTLKVKAFHSRYYNGTIPLGFDYVSDAIHDLPGDRLLDKFAYGITKYIKLSVLSPVYINDIFVKTSVTNNSLTFDVSICNSTNVQKTLNISGTLSSWNNDSWQYPTLPNTNVTVDAGQTKTVTIGPINWGLGKESYWWPNIPFKEDYIAKLHLLSIVLKENNTVYDSQSLRFGFRETEGPNYYMINGVRVNLIGDGTPESGMSEYDCYSTSPAFLPPTGPNTGCPETWKRYMRLGINANRTHQSTPTEYMMNAADEVGFMLITESAIRGSAFNQYWSPYFAQAEKELARVCRNHSSVIIYSLSNEWGSDSRLIDAIYPEDNTRPYIFETYTSGSAKINGTTGGHAFNMMHYSDYPKPATIISGMGEFAWSTDGIAEFSNTGKNMRLNNLSYFAPWDWINFWPNFLQGMDHSSHAWTQNNHADRIDGVDGWGSPAINQVEQSFSPYLVMDQDFEKINKTSLNWPSVIPKIRSGDQVSRTIEIFNDGLSGNLLTVNWEARWDSPTGALIEQGSFNNVQIEPGFHATRMITFTPPAPDTGSRKCYLILNSYKDGTEVYKETRINFNITTDEITVNEANYIENDATTKGSWMGKYGTDGSFVVAGQSKIPSYASIFNWSPITLNYTWANNTTDVRGMEYFGNTADGTGKTRVVAANYTFGTLSYQISLGDTSKNISMYFLDPNNEGRIQKIDILDADNQTILDTQTVSNFSGGIYLRWKMKGNIQVNISNLAGPNCVISGILFDSAQELTKINDSDTRVQYSSNWYTWAEAGSYQNGIHYSNNPAATAAFTFVGASCKIYGVKGWDQGIFEVSIDNNQFLPVDCYQATKVADVVVFDAGTLLNGTHTLVIRPKGTKNSASASTNIAIDAFEYSDVASTDQWSKIDGNDTNISYSNNWYTWTDANANYFGGSVKYSDEANATATLSFIGNKVRFYATKNVQKGIFEAILDGQSQGMIDCFASGSNLADSTSVYESGDLSWGSHTLVIKVTGNKNPLAGFSFISVDAFEIMNVNSISSVSFIRYNNNNNILTKVNPDTSVTDFTASLNVIGNVALAFKNATNQVIKIVN
jgi:hypothetical protein